MTRSEVATFLRELAEELDGVSFDSHSDEEPQEAQYEAVAEEGSAEPRRITFIVGGDSATVTVPNTVEFDVEVESRSPMLSSGVNQDIDLGLSWKIDDRDELNDDWVEMT